MRIGCNGHTSEWIENWAKIPDIASAREGWSHHGVVITGDGDIVASHPGDPEILVFTAEGDLKRSWPTGLTEAHGLTLVREGEKEYLWIADNGSKRGKDYGYKYPPGSEKTSGKVVKKTLKGLTVMELRHPGLPVYENCNYAPTAVAVNGENEGGNGDIWVADGYGADYVHRYDKEGKLIGSINGEEGKAGGFDCPHSIYLDRRGSEPSLYVADRANARFQIYDSEGNFKRAFGSDFLTSPSAIVSYEGFLITAELRARITVIDSNDKLVGYLGENEAVCEIEGWPNSKDKTVEIVRSRFLELCKFNSPHGLDVDEVGNLYVSEWLIGGRSIKLVTV